MKRERSFSINLNELDYGSIYIKPSEDKQSCFNKCFQYFYYFFCGGYIRSR